jgi:hypothetical protein
MTRVTKPPARNLLRRKLEREVAALPPRSLRSIMGIFAHLEGQAAGSDGRGEGPEFKPVLPSHPAAALLSELPEQITFRNLGRQVLATARRQVAGLQGRLERMSSLVLINNWDIADKLWAGFLAACRLSLFELNFVEELWEVNADHLEIDGGSLTRHWHQFVLLQAEVELRLAQRRSLVELSDALDRDLAPWLVRFIEILEVLDEAALA